ncbi:hypothetical protein WME94_32585 [Sorangium sp. So ce429]
MLAVLGGLFALGMGALVVLGGVAYLVASATPEQAVVEPAPFDVSTAGSATPVPPLPTSTPLRPDLEADEVAGADSPNEVAGADPPSGDAPSPVGDDETGDAPAPSSGAASNGSAAGGASWWCTASASVRVCGFAGACNYQMVFGNGGGKDRFLASQQAKRACESSARAKGASAICVVQCSPR